MERSMGKSVLLLLASILGVVGFETTAADTPSLDQLAADLGLPSDAGARIRSGEIVKSDPRESSDREIAVGLAFLVQRRPAEVLEAFREAIDLKADPQLSASVPIRGPGALGDFDSLALEPDGAVEAKRYITAGPGDTLNLSSREIQEFTALAASADPKSGVEAQLKQLLLHRYQAYLANGLAGIPSYARAGGAWEPSGDLRRASEAAQVLQRYAPALQRLLLSYPRGKPMGLEESFFWLRYDLDGRPNYTLRHRLAIPMGDGFAVADREFYVSHGYNASQEIAGLVPVSEGTVIFYRSRVSTDQVAGFGSSMKRNLGRSVMARQLTEIFERSRRSLPPD